MAGKPSLFLFKRLITLMVLGGIEKYTLVFSEGEFN